MAKRAFLIPLALAISGLSQSALAVLKDSTAREVKPDAEERNGQAKSLLQFALPEVGRSEDLIVPSGDELFKFVLHRAQDGQLIAAHESHYSHSSHHSHSSHYSSR